MKHKIILAAFLLFAVQTANAESKPSDKKGNTTEQTTDKQTIDSLKAEVAKLQERIAVLESRLEQPQPSTPIDAKEISAKIEKLNNDNEAITQLARELPIGTTIPPTPSLRALAFRCTCARSESTRAESTKWLTTLL